MESLHESVKRIEPQLIESRRWLHMHAELAWKEFETSAYIREELGKCKHMQVVSPTPTGVVGLLDTGLPGPTIALHADMDALPIQEQNGLSFASCHEGVMHACGHDGHAAILLYAAKIADERFDELCGKIFFVFQHAEEVPPGGGKEILATGILEGVEEIYSIHLSSLFPTGTFATRPGYLTSEVDRFEITVKGRGSHSSLPEQAIDPIVAGAAIISALQTVVSRSLSALEPAAVSVCQVQAGNTYNVIPGTLTMIGSTRVYGPETRALVKGRIEAIAASTAAAYGAAVDFTYEPGYSSIKNDAALEAETERIIRDTFGRDALLVIGPLMPSDDFSAYTDVIPGVSVQIGTSNPEKGTDTPHHNARYLMDEDALALGVEFMLAVLFKKNAKR